MEPDWYLSRPKSPRQRQVEARLAGMDAGEYVAECRDQGMTWPEIARMLSEDTGIPMNPATAGSGTLWNWMRRWRQRQQQMAG